MSCTGDPVPSLEINVVVSATVLHICYRSLALLFRSFDLLSFLALFYLILKICFVVSCADSEPAVGFVVYVLVSDVLRWDNVSLSVQTC